MAQQIPRPSFHYSMRELLKNPSFRSDLLLLGALTKEQKTAIVKGLEEISFADFDTLRTIVSGVGIEDVDSVVMMIYSLAKLCREASTPDGDAIEVFDLAITQSDIEQNKKQVITEAFDELCYSPESFDLLFKASWLAEATGHPVDIIDIVCDIRPVFNKKANEIKGIIPCFTLRIGYNDGETKRVALNLTSRTLEQLKDEVDRAYEKHKTLLSSVSKIKKWEIPHLE